MPVLPFAEGVLKIEVTGVVGAGEFTNIFHIGGGTTEWTLTEVNAAWTYINVHLGNIYEGDGGTDLTVNEVILTDLTSDTSPRVLETPGWTGSRSGISSPASACVLASYGVSRRWRGGHPRTYFPLGDAALMLDSTTWDTSFLEQVATDVAAFNTAINDTPVPGGGSAYMASVSYYTGGVLRTTPYIDEITSVNIKPRICSQRRRLGKIGG